MIDQLDIAPVHSLEQPPSYDLKPIMNTNQIKNAWLTKLSEVLETRLSNPNLSNSDLAQLMNMSERQFYRKVLKTTSKTPNQYFTDFRMKKALKLMQTRQYKTVKEIAFALGYKKDSYFSSLFKKEYGTSPLEMLRDMGLRAKSK